MIFKMHIKVLAKMINLILLLSFVYISIHYDFQKILRIEVRIREISLNSLPFTNLSHRRKWNTAAVTKNCNCVSCQLLAYLSMSGVGSQMPSVDFRSLMCLFFFTINHRILSYSHILWHLSLLLFLTCFHNKYIIANT